MRSIIPKLAHLFIFLLLLGLTTAFFANTELENHFINDDNEEGALKALWSETTIGTSEENFQIGTVVLGVMLFITIYATITYKEEKKDEL